MAQQQGVDFGLGVKYDKFTIIQPENVFKMNMDLGALVFVSYSRSINKKLSWEAGFATNNYKVNFRITSPTGVVFSERELVSVMRSNRLYANIRHHSKQLSQKIFWVNTIGFSVLIGAKNPSDMILERQATINTSSGSQNVNIKVKTYGLTGSVLMFSLGSRLYYQISQNYKLVANLGFITGTSEVTKVDIDYVFNSDPTYKKAIFSSNGFAPYLTFGASYIWQKDKK